MRLAIILAALTFLSACTERQVFQMRWIEDLTFFIEMKTEPQELKQIAIETLEEEAQEVPKPNTADVRVTGWQRAAAHARSRVNPPARRHRCARHLPAEKAAL